MANIQGALSRFGIVRIGVIASVVLSLGIFFYFIVNRAYTPDMELLYGDLDLSDGSRIISRLDLMGIKSEVKGGGSQIYVPSNEVTRLRMALAEDGLPSGGNVGYEIFDRSDSLGTTSFVNNINKVRALEGELSRTIRSLAKVSSARIHLVLPKKDLFNREVVEPRASIMLRLTNVGKLGSGQVKAIQHLVAAAVPGLSVRNISIVDDKGNLLARGMEGDEDATTSNLDESRFEYESRLGKSLEALIGRIVGFDKVRAEVTADMDFDRQTENSEIFNPDGQVIRSTQTVEDGQNTKETSAVGGGGVSVANSIPGAKGGAGNEANNSEHKHTEETINYEISKTLKTHIHENGGIKRISVALLVDGNHVTDANGKTEYHPRTKEELAQIERLVKSTIGFDAKRGDVVEVVNMQFAPIEAIVGGVESNAGIMGLEKNQVIHLIEIFVVSLFGLLALLLVVKPVLSKVVEGSTGDPANENKQEADNVSLIPGVVPGASQAPISGNMAQPVLPATEALKAADQNQQLMMKKQEHAVKSIGQAIDHSLDESVGVVRSWINEGS